MSRSRFIIFLFLFVSFQGWSQKTFITKIDNQNRAYFYTSSRSINIPNKPLFLILPANDSNIQQTFASDTIWKSMASAVNLVFPASPGNHWNCSDSMQMTNDVLFLKEIISATYLNFKIDRNRVYIIGLQGSQCSTAAFEAAYPQYLAQKISINHPVGSEEIIEQIEQLLNKDYKTDTIYQLYESAVAVTKPKTNPSDSLKRYSYKNRWVLAFHYGGFYMLPGAQTPITNDTYMDISKAHSFIGFELTKWGENRVGWFIDFSKLAIPKEQKIWGHRMKVGGGLAVPVTLGMKYQLVRHNFYNPYVMVGAGTNYLLISGGKIYTDKPMPEKQVETIKQWSFQATIGSGVDFRFGKRVVLGTQFRYIHSNKFDEIGSIDAIRAFNFNFSASFIINANSEKINNFDKR